MMGEQRTILVTFAGRRDRMQLLTRYVGAAIERGLIDEWHVWDFARNADDADVVAAAISCDAGYAQQFAGVLSIASPTRTPRVPGELALHRSRDERRASGSSARLGRRAGL